jgi:ATP-dependent RNA helicase RhlE
MKRLPKKRQNLMFSATYSDDIRQLAQGLLRDPVEIEVARRNAAIEVIEQYMYPVAKDQKRALLSHLIRSGDWMQVLVFTRTKHGANRLTQQLQDDGITAAAIHGNKSQGARTTALRGFKEQKIRALVATEVAARGLDIKELPHVVNYELPNVPEDYVHRIGRTGRAGASGEAISLVAPDETGLLKDIERTTRKTIERRALPAISAPPPRAHADANSESPERSSQQNPTSHNRPPRQNNHQGNRAPNNSTQRNAGDSNRSQAGGNRSGTGRPGANRPSTNRPGSSARSANQNSRPRGRG